MSAVRLDVLGGFGLRVDGQDGPALPRKSRALLAVLAVEQGRPMARERVGELLWPNSGPEQVYGSLREALYQLRRPLRGHEVVISQDGTLALGAAVATDVAEFERQAMASDLAGLQCAANAYAGPLLHGFPIVAEDFDEWLSVSRAELERKALAVLARIGDLCTAAGDAAAALEAAERMFAIDPLREETHRRLLECCAAAGRRAEGLRHYNTIIETLKRELGIAPGAQTRDLVRKLRAEMDPPAQVEQPRPEPVPLGAPPPIAVLPFTQLGDETVPSHVADGIMVDTVCQLAGLRELQVISHGSTLSYRDPKTDLRQVGRELGARYVVRGAMRRRGSTLRLTTELADAGTGALVWARSHDTSATLDFADQDRLVANIVNTLAPRVQEAELHRIRGRRPESLSAYELILHARYNLQALTPDLFDQTRRLLVQALEVDAAYADTYALLAEWHGLRISQSLSRDTASDETEAERYSRLALSMDPNNIRALIRHAHRRSLLHRDFGAAKRLFAKALDQAPNSAHAWLWSSLTYSYGGDGDDGLRRAERAMQLSPCDPEAHFFYSAACIAHYTARRYQEASEWAERALSEPVLSHSLMPVAVAAFIGAGRAAKAREVAQVIMKHRPGFSARRLRERHPYADEHRRALWEQRLLEAGLPP